MREKKKKRKEKTLAANTPLSSRGASAFSFLLVADSTLGEAAGDSVRGPYAGTNGVRGGRGVESRGRGCFFFRLLFLRADRFLLSRFSFFRPAPHFVPLLSLPSRPPQPPNNKKKQGAKKSKAARVLSSLLDHKQSALLWGSWALWLLLLLWRCQSSSRSPLGTPTRTPPLPLPLLHKRRRHRRRPTFWAEFFFVFFLERDWKCIRFVLGEGEIIAGIFLDTQGK